MPGGVSSDPIANGVFFVASMSYLVAPPIVSGWFLHRAKCSSKEGMELVKSYAKIYLIYLLPNIPLFLIVCSLEDAIITLAAICYYAVMTGMLFATLYLTPPGKRYFMVIPGLLTFPVFALFLFIIGKTGLM